MKDPANRIAIFASGSGTNAENIINYFRKTAETEVSLVLSNNPAAYVLERAKKLNIPTISFTRKEIYGTQNILNRLKQVNIDFIILAGFLWLVPENLVKAYPNRIMNIHPALLPKYGGKGMYGDRVHQAVKEAGEKETGITIHYVNERYDEGQILLQAKCDLSATDDIAAIAAKVHTLEYEHYPRVIESVINNYHKNL